MASDLTEAPRVVRGIEAVEVFAPEESGVGTRWREPRTVLRRSATEDMTVTAVEPEWSYTTEAVRPGVRYLSTVAVTPAGDGRSDLAMTFEAQPRSTLARVLGAVTGPLGRRVGPGVAGGPD